MPTPYTDAIAAIKAVWAARWTPVTGVPVLWHENSADPVPTRADGTRHWLHLSVDLIGDGTVAYGGGNGQNEKEVDGAVAVRVFAFRGIGDTTQMQLLDAAVDAFRNQRVGALTIIGDVTQENQGASDDGAWWVKTAIVSFLWRYRG